MIYRTSTEVTQQWIGIDTAIHVFIFTYYKQ